MSLMSGGMLFKAWNELISPASRVDGSMLRHKQAMVRGISLKGLVHMGCRKHYARILGLGPTYVPRGRFEEGRKG